MGIVAAEDTENETENEAPVIEEERVTIPVADDEDRTPPDRQETAQTDRKTRKDYRDGKKLDWKAELRARDEQISHERGERARIDRELAELKGRFSERHAKDNEVDYEAKIESLQDKANQHLANAHGAGANQALAKSEMAAYYKTMREITRVDRQAEAAKEAKERPQQQQAQELPREVQSDIIRTFHDFPWLRTNVQARNETDMLIDSMVRDGYPNTYQTFKAAAAQVAQANGLGGRAAPNGAARQRFAGVGAGEGDGGSSSPRTVKMGDHERRMAEARYPELSAEQAHAKWARDIGSKLPQKNA